MNGKYFLGLDIGTDSVGYAVTDAEYSLKKFRGEPMWGVHLFDQAEPCADRRGFRTARRRLDRRQQRVRLLREIFADEIVKIDSDFFIRQDKSALYAEDSGEQYSIFNDDDYSDVEYHAQYPTIHHLICELMDSDEPHDVRLVYLACAWLVAHRGHFLSEISIDNIDSATDFSTVYSDFEIVLWNRSDGAVSLPWNTDVVERLGEILKKKTGISKKSREISDLLFGGKTPKESVDFALNFDAAINLICGGKVSAKDLFCNDEYSEISSFSLDSDDEVIAGVMAQIGEDADILQKMKAVFDWSQLSGMLVGSSSISEAKVKIYNTHSEDLKFLKKYIRKYLPGKYNDVFRGCEKGNYSSYSHHTKDPAVRFSKKEDFCDYIKKLVKGVSPDGEDVEKYEDMMERLDTRTFMPKQKSVENRVVPRQLYQYELIKILEKAEKYIPSLAIPDADGFTKTEKILSVFSFRVPYYVGPLNDHSQYAWIVRKAQGRITPWNFTKMVDEDACEQEFVNRLINQCTYLPSEKVVPKNSLIYHKFSVLNEINNIRVNDQPISVEQKQDLYTNLFLKRRKVTVKAIRTHLGLASDQQLTGIDETIKSDLKPYHDFARLLKDGTLSEEQVEEIILHRTCAEDKTRFVGWLRKEYPAMDDADIKYISRLNYKDFGRLSSRFLNGLEGTVKATGEVFTIISALWNTNDNLMQLLSDRYTFAETVEQIRAEYYGAHTMTVAERLDDMYLPNAIKRPVIRTLDIVRDVVKVMGCPPERIFVEMTRGKDSEPKRTKSRKEQILDLYAKCKNEDVRILTEQLKAMGDEADSRLRGEKLFLYFMQFGKCAYSGETINLSELKDKTYDIEHIYPRAYVKDDSIINNKVLVLSKLNGEKSDTYPIASEIRQGMASTWACWHNAGTISDEKYKRLTRSTAFSEDEKQGFINRQLVETSQATKAVTVLLREKYPDSEIVFVKARLTSEFRQQFNMLKSREFNDLHHAKDAYLNIVTGNVYYMLFTKTFFDTSKRYSIKTESIFGNEPKYSRKEKIWNGQASITRIKETIAKNNVHCTKYAFCRHGGFFDQMPLPKAEGLIQRKADLPTEKYGGYAKPTVTFFILVKYRTGKKVETMMMPIELMHRDEFLRGGAAADHYAKQRIGSILKKKVDEVSFPIGLRPIKINTVLSLDGFLVTIAGGAGGGKCIIAAPFMPFCASPVVETYIKRLEGLTEKVKEHPNYVYDAEFDKVTPEENLALFDLYVSKIKTTIYRKRPNPPTEIFEKGRAKFAALDVFGQAAALLNMHSVFGRVSGGCDLSAIGGSARAAATVNFSSSLSNWKKNYTDVRIIDTSASGLWEERSQNLLELI